MLIIAFLDIYSSLPFLLHIYTFLRMNKTWKNKKRTCFEKLIEKPLKSLLIEFSHLINGNYLKRASPKAANIHNSWLSCRRQRSLRLKE